MNDFEEIRIPEDMHDILDAGSIGTLTTMRKDGLFSTNPVGYYWDGDRIYVSTLKSRVKYSNIAADPRIALCVISPQNATRYVEIRGYGSLQDDPDKEYMLAVMRFGAKGREMPPTDLDPPGAERAVILIHPVQVSSPILYGGRLDQRDGNA